MALNNTSSMGSILGARPDFLTGVSQTQSGAAPYQLPGLSEFGNSPSSAWQFNHAYGMYAPIANAGLRQLPNLTAGATPEGYNERIGQILGMDSTQRVIGDQQRQLKSALASSGMRRSGYGARAAADIPQQVAQALEGQMMGRSQSLFGVGQGALGQQNEALMQMQDALAGDEAAGDARSDARRQRNQGYASTAIGLMAMFSDERLKTDIVPEGEKDGIPLISWTWNEEANKKGLFGRALGVSAQKVREIMPKAVKSGEDGYLRVDYGMLFGGDA